jgi:hypothetical protein
VDRLAFTFAPSLVLLGGASPGVLGQFSLGLRIW